MLIFLQAEELCRAKGIELPQDFLEAAMDNGLRTIVLEEYIRLQVGGLKWLLRHVTSPVCSASVLTGTVTLTRGASDWHAAPPV